MAFIGLNALNTIVYNGFQFTGATELRVRVEKVRDEANTTVIYHRFVLSLRAYVAAGNDPNTDASLDTILQALSHDGADLYVVAAGVGTYIDVNRPSGVQDVNWGPKTELLDWQPIGSNQAAEIAWQVTTCIPVCENAPRYDGIIAINYATSFDRNEHGDITRTTSGYYEIALTRAAGSNVIPDSADDDKYRQQIATTIPEGFTRRERWDCSADKRRMRFNFVDSQIPSPNPFPPFVTSISGSHEVRAQRSSGYAQNSLSLEITQSASITGAEAWAIFLNILGKRFKAFNPTGQGMFLDSIAARESIFGRVSSFSASWRTTLKRAILDGGAVDLPENGPLWQPLGYNWRDWHESLYNDGTHTSRGTSKLKEAAGTARIVDLCQSNSEMLIASITEDTPLVSSSRPLGLQNQVPDPDQSYLKYHATVEVDETRPVVVHSIMQEPDSTAPTGANMLDSQPANFESGPGVEDIIQERGQGSYRLVFRGHAVRVAHDIPRPELPPMPGLTPVRESSKVVYTDVGTFFGVRLVAAAWRITYLLTKAPGIVTPPRNLAMPGDDSATASAGVLLPGP